MHSVESQIGGAGDMQPMQVAGHPQTAFIHVDYRSLNQSAHDHWFHGRERLIGLLIGLGQGAQAQGLAEQVQQVSRSRLKGRNC